MCEYYRVSSAPHYLIFMLPAYFESLLVSAGCVRQSPLRRLVSSPALDRSSVTLAALSIRLSRLSLTALDQTLTGPVAVRDIPAHEAWMGVSDGSERME